MQLEMQGGMGTILPLNLRHFFHSQVLDELYPVILIPLC